MFIQENAFENVIRNLAAILSEPWCVKDEMHIFADIFILFKDKIQIFSSGMFITSPHNLTAIDYE